jgi:hypothetical protein
LNSFDIAMDFAITPKSVYRFRWFIYKKDFESKFKP